MPEKIYDVAIVGAGPAGSFLSYLLAKDGLDVILIEKEKLPRKKVCAGGLTPKVLEILPFSIEHLIYNRITQLLISHRLKKYFQKSYIKPLVYTVERKQFDFFLVEQAEKAGAFIFDETEVKKIEIAPESRFVFTPADIFRARIVVGADGANSLIARTLGLKPIDFLGVALQAEAPRDSLGKKICDFNNTIMLDLGVFPNSYGWLFPRGDVYAIGAGGPIQYGQKLNGHESALLDYFQVPSSKAKIEGHPIQGRLGNQPITHKRCLLVGEAAGLVNSWTGEGIYYALKSAQIASSEIVRYFKGEINDFSSYETRINREIMPDLRSARLFSKIFDAMPHLIFCVIRDFDYPWDIICRLSRGDRTFDEIKKRLRPDIFLRKAFIKSSRGI